MAPKPTPKKAPRAKQQAAPSKGGAVPPRKSRQQGASKKKPPRTPLCPCLSSQEAFSYEVFYRRPFSLSGVTGQNVIFVLAPWNDTLGWTFTQDITLPSSNNASFPITASSIVDPYLTNLLTRTTTPSGNSLNSLACRFTSFCAEISVTTAIQNVASSIMLLRWREFGCPSLATSSLAQDHFATYSGLVENHETIERPSAMFLASRCFHTGMADRTALEFQNVNVGTTDWLTAYGTTGGATTSVGSFQPWNPIVIFANAVAGTTLDLRINIRARIQVIPALNTFLSRLTKPLPTGPPSAEKAWWDHQKMLMHSPDLPIPSVVNRSYGPTAGL